METVEEDVEEYSWREVVLPRLVPVVPDAPPELERETGERRRGPRQGPPRRRRLRPELQARLRLGARAHRAHRRHGPPRPRRLQLSHLTSPSRPSFENPSLPAYSIYLASYILIPKALVNFEAVLDYAVGW